MSDEDIRPYYRAEPFTVRVARGREGLVGLPEFMAISPSGRSVVVTAPDGFFEMIDMPMITSIHLGTGMEEERRRRSR